MIIDASCVKTYIGPAAPFPMNDAQKCLFSIMLPTTKVAQELAKGAATSYRFLVQKSYHSYTRAIVCVPV